MQLVHRLILTICCLIRLNFTHTVVGSAKINGDALFRRKWKRCFETKKQKQYEQETMKYHGARYAFVVIFVFRIHFIQDQWPKSS